MKQIVSIIRNLLILFAFVFFSSACFAVDTIEISLENDYLLTSDFEVKSVVLASPSVVSITPFTTIYNEKNILLLHPKKIGKTSFVVNLKDKSVPFNLVVTSAGASFDLKPIATDGFEINELDVPPSIIEVAPLQQKNDRRGT